MTALRLGVIRPEDAIQAFTAKRLLLPSFHWDDVFQEQHAKGIAMAGVSQFDVLQILRDELDAKWRDGLTLREFKKSIQPQLAAKGFWGDVEVTDPATGKTRITKFNDARLNLIYDTNVRQAYNAGKWNRYQRTKKRYPFLRYLTRDDDHVRLAHQPWHNLILPIDDPWWDTHMPQNGWGCRCEVVQCDQAEIDRLLAEGKKIKLTAPPDEFVDYKNKRTGETVKVPVGIDPGFAHNPGKAQLEGAVPRPLPTDALRPAPERSAPAVALPPSRTLPKSLLLPSGQPEQSYVDAFLEEFGATMTKPAEFTDVTGQQLVIDQSMFTSRDGSSKLLKRGRESFLRVLAEAIKRPDEIWMLESLQGAAGTPVLRRRYVARFVIQGLPQPMVAVYEWGKDGWLGVSGFQADNADYLFGSTVRVGTLVYRRGEQIDPLAPPPIPERP